jgi:hypothetical protein
MSTANLSSLSILTNIITAPLQAFAALKERPASWLPLLILIVSYSAVTAAYITSVDLPWMLDQALQQADGIPQAQREQALQAALKISPSAYAAIYVVVFAICVPVVFAVIALYSSAVSFATGDGVKFKQWFGAVVRNPRRIRHRRGARARARRRRSIHAARRAESVFVRQSARYRHGELDPSSARAAEPGPHGRVVARIVDPRLPGIQQALAGLCGCGGAGADRGDRCHWHAVGVALTERA